MEEWVETEKLEHYKSLYEIDWTQMNRVHYSLVSYEYKH
jgi:hypothetical protein